MRCIVCNSEDFKRTTFGGYRFRDKDYYYFRCQVCQFIQIDPVPNDEEIKLLYNNEYYRTYYIKGSKRLGYILNKNRALKNAEKFLSYLFRFKKTGLLLDVGCAGGYFILAAKELGFDVLGMEQNYEMVNFAVKQLNLNAVCSDTTRCFKPERFDVIHYGDVINSLNNPNVFIADSISTLKRGGLLAVESSIAFNSSFAQTIFNFIHAFKDNPFDWITDNAPYELCQFNSFNLSRYFEKFNLRILDFKIFEEPLRTFSVERELRSKVTAKFIYAYILNSLSCAIDNLPFKFLMNKGSQYWLIAQKQ